MDRWIPLTDDRPHAYCLCTLFGLSSRAIKSLAKERGLPLRRVSPNATPGIIQSELIAWIREHGIQR